MIADMVTPFQGQDINNVDPAILSRWLALQKRKHAKNRARPLSHHVALMAAVEKRLRAVSESVYAKAQGDVLERIAK